MEKRVSFRDYAIVACGTLNMELNRLKDSGLLDARKEMHNHYSVGFHLSPSGASSNFGNPNRSRRRYSIFTVGSFGSTYLALNSSLVDASLSGLITPLGSVISRYFLSSKYLSGPTSGIIGGNGSRRSYIQEEGYLLAIYR